MYRKCLVVLFFAGALFAQNQASAPTHSLLEKLYRLVWPAGRFKGDLVTTVSRNTQKGASNPENPRLYLVDTRKRALTEWNRGEGAVEPVVCAAESALYYRRDSTIVGVPLKLTNDGRVDSAGPAVELNAPPVNGLVACTGTDKGSVLWVQDTSGRLVRMVRSDGKLRQTSQAEDSELEQIPTHSLADYLRLMRSMRPDGFTVCVVNHALLGEISGKERFLVVDSDSIQFSGIPAWVPDTDVLFVTGMNEGSK